MPLRAELINELNSTPADFERMCVDHGVPFRVSYKKVDADMIRRIYAENKAEEQATTSQLVQAGRNVVAGAGRLSDSVIAQIDQHVDQQIDSEIDRVLDHIEETGNNLGDRYMKRLGERIADRKFASNTVDLELNFGGSAAALPAAKLNGGVNNGHHEVVQGFETVEPE